MTSCAPRDSIQSSYGRSVRVDVLHGPGRRWVTVRNLLDREVEAAIEVPKPPADAPVEMFTGETAQLKNKRMCTVLGPGQIKAFWMRDA